MQDTDLTVWLHVRNQLRNLIFETIKLLTFPCKDSDHIHTPN